jgi:hypothetical protein
MTVKVVDRKDNFFSVRYPSPKEAFLEAALKRNGFFGKNRKAEMINAFIDGRLVLKREDDYSKKEKQLSDTEALLRSNKELLETIRTQREHESGTEKLIPPLIFFTTEDDYKLFTEELKDTVVDFIKYSMLKQDLVRRIIRSKKSYNYNFIIISTRNNYGGSAKLLKEENVRGTVIYPSGYATFRDFFAARGPEVVKQHVQSMLIEIKSLAF